MNKKETIKKVKYYEDKKTIELIYEYDINTGNLIKSIEYRKDGTLKSIKEF